MRTATVILLLALLSACDTAGEDRAAQEPAGEVSTSSTPSATIEATDTLDLTEGLVEVRGHDLYVRCAGHGSPTVLYLHGWAQFDDFLPVDNALYVEGKLHHSHRFCSYERRNVGRSEQVPGSQSPKDVVADVLGVLEASDVQGPVILLGASFGGMVAHAFAVTYPERVAGIVLLDALFPDEIELAPVMPAKWRPCWRRNRLADARQAVERLEQCALYRYSMARRDAEPKVPLIYFASRQERWDEVPDATPAYARRIVELQKAYVARWSPGRFAWVDAPHFMETAIAIPIARAIREVARLETY